MGDLSLLCVIDTKAIVLTSAYWPLKSKVMLELNS